MTAIRFGLFDLGIVTALTAGLTVTALVRPPGHPAGSPQLEEPPAADEPPIEPTALGRLCDAEGITTIIVRGQFMARDGWRAHSDAIDQFAIQLPGKGGSYSAITDSRGYFEMRIPREDFADDLCDLDEWNSFSDDQITLNYFVEFE
ncbi:MAG TPA: hypothetical protein VLB44_01725 [Kofleriaceae bacterium]|nr:hypothetical protein [Kofleriaceae bacterium]